MNNLLITSDTFKTIVLVAFCVLLGLSFLYGVLRKLSRMSWLGWQTALLWLVTLAFAPLCDSAAPTLAFGVAVGVTLAVVILLFAIGALVRKPMLGLEGGGAGGKAFNCLAGGVTGVFNVFVFFAVFGGLALVVLQPFEIEALASLDEIYNSVIWANFFGAHALDLFIVFLFAAILRWGYRTGFLRMIVSIVVLALVFLAVFLSMYVTIHVSFLASLSSAIAGMININSIAAEWIGFGVTSFLVALVLLLVVVFIAWALNLLLKAAGKSHAFSASDGVLFALITCVFFVAFLCAFNLGVSYLVDLVSGSVAEGTEAAPELFGKLEPYILNFEKVLKSSPLSSILYEGNPLHLIVG